jgi:hypothetical protein
MNISYAESPLTVIVKTCGCKGADTKKAAYTFIDSYHNLCLDKKDIVLAEIEASIMRNIIMIIILQTINKTYKSLPMTIFCLIPDFFKFWYGH